MPPIITRACTRVVWSSGRGRRVDGSPRHWQSKATNQHLVGRGWNSPLSQPSLFEIVQPGSRVWLHLSTKVNDKKGFDSTDNCWGVLAVWCAAACFHMADCWLLLITDSWFFVPIHQLVSSENTSWALRKKLDNMANVPQQLLYWGTFVNWLNKKFKGIIVPLQKQLLLWCWAFNEQISQFLTTVWRSNTGKMNKSVTLLYLSIYVRKIDR